MMSGDDEEDDGDDGVDDNGSNGSTGFHSNESVDRPPATSGGP